MKRTINLVGEVSDDRQRLVVDRRQAAMMLREIEACLDAFPTPQQAANLRARTHKLMVLTADGELFDVVAVDWKRTGSAGWDDIDDGQAIFAQTKRDGWKRGAARWVPDPARRP